MSGCLPQRAKGLVHRSLRRQEEKRKRGGMRVSPQLLLLHTPFGTHVTCARLSSFWVVCAAAYGGRAWGCDGASRSFLHHATVARSKLMQDIASCMSGRCNSSLCDQKTFLHHTAAYMHRTGLSLSLLTVDIHPACLAIASRVVQPRHWLIRASQ